MQQCAAKADTTYTAIVVLADRLGLSTIEPFVVSRLVVSRSYVLITREAVRQRLEFLLGVGRNCCGIGKQHVSDENLAYVCLGSELDEVEEPAI